MSIDVTKGQALRALNIRLAQHKKNIDLTQEFSQKNTLHHVAYMECTGAIIFAYGLEIFDEAEYTILFTQLENLSSANKYELTL